MTARLARLTLFVTFGLLTILAPLVPLAPGADRVPPDLLYCVVMIWVLRAPAAAPLWAVLALGLLADALLMRPPGLGRAGSRARLRSRARPGRGARGLRLRRRMAGRLGPLRPPHAGDPGSAASDPCSRRRLGGGARAHHLHRAVLRPARPCAGLAPAADRIAPRRASGELRHDPRRRPAAAHHPSRADAPGHPGRGHRGARLAHAPAPDPAERSLPPARRGKPHQHPPAAAGPRADPRPRRAADGRQPEQLPGGDGPRAGRRPGSHPRPSRPADRARRSRPGAARGDEPQRLRARRGRRTPDLGRCGAGLGQCAAAARHHSRGRPQPHLSRRPRHGPCGRLCRPGLRARPRARSRTPTRCCRSRASRSARTASSSAWRTCCAAAPAPSASR